MASDPNVAKVELIAKALGPLRERLVLVGGCAAGLLITDPAAAPAMPDATGYASFPRWFAGISCSRLNATWTGR